MNLTWHIVKKDLRALRWPLGAWFACIIAKLGVGVLLLNANGDEGIDWFKQMETFAQVMAVGEVLSFVLVAALIQEDLMVGTEAFWMTRPISGGRLLRAKFLTIGLVFLLAPLLVTLPWWLGCGYGIDEIAWAAAETLAVHALVVLAALIWSAVTDGLGRFVMWSLVTLVVTPMLTAILAYYVRNGRPGPVPEVISTRALVAVGLIAIGTLVMLIHQYRTRHLWRSIAIIASTTGLVVLTLAFWPWAWNVEAKIQGYFIRRAQGEWPAAAEPPGLRFMTDLVEFPARRPDRPGTLNTRFRVEGLGESQGLIGYPSEHRWQWADGTSEKGYGMGRSVLNSIALNRASAFAKGGAAPAVDTEQVTITSILSTATLNKLHAQPADFTLAARFRLMKYDSTTPVPIEAGKWQGYGLMAERIAAVEKLGDQQHVTFIRHLPALWVDIVGGGHLVPNGKFARYFLVNRKIGWVDAGQTVEIRTTRIGTVEIGWQTLYFHATPKAGTRPTLESINALNDAELIKVNFSELARFTREFHIDAAQIAQANP